MRKAGRIAAAARALARDMIAPGMTTKKIDHEIKHFITKEGAYPTFLHYNNFPACVCLSINEEVIHGIPASRVLKRGDIVSVDVGATWKGYVGDCAATFVAGECTEEARHLIDVTKQSFFEGIRQARAGNRVGDISHAVQTYVESNGCSVVREYVGHGVGSNMHEAPEVPNFGKAGHGPLLVKGMTIAVEPMVNAGGWEVYTAQNNWTVKTKDGSLSAHYENTILITDGEPEILTYSEDL